MLQYWKHCSEDARRKKHLTYFILESLILLQIYLQWVYCTVQYSSFVSRAGFIRM